METVGFIGLGKMGTPLAINIQKAGYPMVVYDAREEAVRPLLEGGARLAGSPAEVARLCDVVATCLPRPQVVEQVVTGPEGILEGIQSGGNLPGHFHLRAQPYTEPRARFSNKKGPTYWIHQF